MLFGVSFIDQSTVETLRNAQTRLGTRNQQLRDRIVALENESESLKAYVSSSRDAVVRGALEGRSVVIVGFESTPASTVEAVVGTIELAGGRVDGSLTLSDRLDLRTDDGRRRLAAVLESPSLEARGLAELAVAQLTAALAAGDAAFLRQLIGTGLATGTPPSGEPASLGRAVVVAGGRGSRELNERIALPLVRSLASSPVVTAVVEAGSTSLQMLTSLRQDSGLRVVTVDGIDTPLGQAALATGLRAGFGGQFGSYGFGPGATTALPAG